MVYQLFENNGIWTAVLMDYWKNVICSAEGASQIEAFEALLLKEAQIQYPDMAQPANEITA